MNITKLVGLHLYNYLEHNGELDTQTHVVLKRQIDEDHDLQDRKTLPGHVTSSFFLLSTCMTKVLLIHHIVHDKWICPGGHYEGDVAPRTSALRELEEETGFPSDQVGWLGLKSYIALDIDTHVIPARPSKGETDHYHHDFLYIGMSQIDFQPVAQLEEVHAAKWVTLDEASTMPDARLRRAVEKARKLIQE